MDYGIFKGEQCNRNGCAGIIDQHPTETQCSCHINPPCSHCVDSREYCPECGWEGADDQADKQKIDPEIERRNQEYYARENARWQEQRESFYRKFSGAEVIEKLEIRCEPHTNFSQIQKGVFPKGTETRATIEEKVKGTFGGRFSRFTETTFEYIAYTD